MNAGNTLSGNWRKAVYVSEFLRQRQCQSGTQIIFTVSRQLGEKQSELQNEGKGSFFGRFICYTQCEVISVIIKKEGGMIIMKMSVLKPDTLYSMYLNRYLPQTIIR